jgi:hypothetical protein
MYQCKDTSLMYQNGAKLALSSWRLLDSVQRKSNFVGEARSRSKAKTKVDAYYCFSLTPGTRTWILVEAEFVFVGWKRGKKDDKLQLGLHALMRPRPICLVFLRIRVICFEILCNYILYFICVNFQMHHIHQWGWRNIIWVAMATHDH